MQLFNGGYAMGEGVVNWDGHKTLVKQYAVHGPILDQAVAGVKRACSYGATDEFGYKASENVTTIYDLYATIRHLLGLDHTRLSFYNNGIERRLADVHGHVIEPILV